jgi:PTH2 family peptidyl-tRNA hydrolase
MEPEKTIVDRSKQVIVIRKDLKMRRGKEIAQGCHAAMAFLTRQIQGQASEFDYPQGGGYEVIVKPAAKAWIDSNFAKVCVRVESEVQLDLIAEEAKKLGIECHVVVDSGLTEFNGVPIKTCLALGPDRSELIDKVTGHLELY